MKKALDEMEKALKDLQDQLSEYDNALRQETGKRIQGHLDSCKQDLSDLER